MFGNVALRSAGLWVILSLAVGHLSEQEKTTIVDLHNKLRSKVEPSATFMQKVVWDENLRLVAEAYASKCIWNHNPDIESLALGENLFVCTGPFNATKALMDWFEERVDYEYETNSCTEDKMCGHYTQMVWAGSNKIGCATHLCDTLEGLDFEKATLLVCNYHPQGNFEGQKPYVSGESCSQCPDELPVCENSICVTENLFHPSEDPDDVKETSSVVPERPYMTTEPSAAPEDPVDVKETSTVARELPYMSTETSAVLEELTEVYVIIEDMESTSHGSAMERVSAALLMVVGLLAALVL